jgi:hypothetical protein
MFKFDGPITARDYVGMLCSQVQPMIQTLLPNKHAVFLDDNPASHTDGTVQSWYVGELQYLPWPARSPYLNITEQFWSVLETRGTVRNRFPLPAHQKQLEHVLEECNAIPGEPVQSSYQSIPRIAAVLKAKSGQFAICTSTFSKLCKNMYTVACRRVLSSAPL